MLKQSSNWLSQDIVWLWHWLMDDGSAVAIWIMIVYTIMYYRDSL